METQRLHDPVDVYSETLAHKIAIESLEKNFTYAELGIQQNAIACALQSSGVHHQDRIGVFVEDLAWAYPAILGTSKCGAIYVPLNVEFPDQRLCDIVEDADISVICCQRKILSRAKELAKNLKKNKLLILDEFNDEDLQNEHLLIPLFEKSPTPAQQELDDIAYLMYTSGSTGKPKGVMVPHRAVIAFISWALSEFNLSPSDRFTQHSRLSFDLSIFDIFAALFCGGTLCPIERKIDLAFPGHFILKNKISVCLSVPGVIGMMDRTDQLKLNLSSCLKYYLVCGEALSPTHAARWIEAQPQIPLYNLYGPTEATVACSFHPVSPEDVALGSESISIGVPIPGSEMLIFNDQLTEELPNDEVGKLMLKGDQLSLGYWKREDLTKAVFVLHPDGKSLMYNSGDLAKKDSKGQFQWMGRADQQVNINGYRVELMEIEALVSKMNMFSECAVLAHGQPLELYVFATLPESVKGQKSIATIISEIATFCSAYLPDYMIPRNLMLRDSLPRNVNGKIDRKAILNELKTQSS